MHGETLKCVFSRSCAVKDTLKNFTGIMTITAVKVFTLLHPIVHVI